MHISDRDVEIYVMREGGATYETISKIYGISTERVRQISQRITMKKNQVKLAAGIKDDLHDLTWGCRVGYSSRIYNALRRYGIKTTEDFMALKPEDILQIPRLGEKSLRIIRELQEKKRLEETRDI